MSLVALILREIRHRKVNFLLGVMAIVTAVTLFVAFFTTGMASKEETTRLMRDIGFNVRIVSSATDMEQFWKNGFSPHFMPQSYVDKLATYKGFSYAHLVATLQQHVPWNGLDILLTGIAPEQAPPGTPKSPMIFSVTPGTVKVGHETARRFGLERGHVIELMGRSFTIARIIPERGSVDDIRMYGALEDVQALLGMENRINEIMALQCLCIVDGVNIATVEVLEQQLTDALPETRVILLRSIAEAREQQRIMAEEYFSFILPVLLVICMAWIFVLAFINVRERQQEIGVLRALGYGSRSIASLFLGKAVLIGLAGAGIGFVAGTLLAMSYGPDIFKVTAGSITPNYILCAVALCAAPLFSALAACVPSIMAVTQDPAVILRDN